MAAQDHPDWSLETTWWRGGCHLVAGVDEAGRGAWAGPVVAGAVILPPFSGTSLPWISQLDDSKRCTATRRDSLRRYILVDAVSVGIGCAGVWEIDSLGIAVASRLAMMRAIRASSITPDALLIDYFPLPALDLPQQAVAHGDALSLSIAAASIIAKTTRDALLRSVNEPFPTYGFARHKGYGTQAHRMALHQYGPCPLHRRSFAPIAALAFPDMLEGSQ